MLLNSFSLAALRRKVMQQEMPSSMTKLATQKL
jgi:hypothetical protein